VNVCPRRHIIARLVVLAVVLSALAVIPTALFAGTPEPVDLNVITQIRQEGFHNSQVMQILGELTDRIGPRVTGSPNMKKANEWTRDKLAEWGLANAHLEGYDFGRGWAEEFTSVRMITPDTAMLWAIPKAWTPGTNGVVKGKVVKVNIRTKEDLDKYRGKLAGMIVMTTEPKELKPHTEPEATRYSDQRLAEIAQYGIPGGPRMGMGGGAPPNREEMMKAMQLRRELGKFFEQEKVLAVIEPSMYDFGEVTMSGNPYKVGETVNVPTLNMAAEHYGRISRLLDRNVPVELELNVQTKFYDDDTKAYNTIAELPGSDKKLADQVVIIGGHLDSWHGGTGATDNATGVAAAMEALRILKTLDLKPRRTIRIALWSGEEQGLLGSRAYVAEHLAFRPEPKDPKQSEIPAWMRSGKQEPLELKPEYSKVAAYFNLDNGTGKLRGIYAQENAAVVPIFESWIAPFKDLGCTTVTMRNTGGTDHQSFDGVGIPGFQFIQDPIEYSTRTHHSNMDVYERVQREDLMQQAVILASFAYNAAMRDEELPRKPLPKDAVAKTDAPAPAPTKAAVKK
jgi:carboxypeptidase Q